MTQFLTSHSHIYVGCAGWNVPREAAARFPEEGSHLQRYSCRFPAVEINSSFYRPHQRKTYEKWASSVPAAFRFSVKIPKSITHQQRLHDPDELLARFLDEVAGLGETIGCLLVQLPPSLVLDISIAANCFASLGRRVREIWKPPTMPAVVCEPRHSSWFTAAANELFLLHGITRVIPDPVAVPAGGNPAGFPDVVYFRLHGSPRMYYSNYNDAYLAALSISLKQHLHAGRESWCIFDNTALGAATLNAFSLLQQLA
jgi:uncharacterized protein YecE (DUF72 family)